MGRIVVVGHVEECPACLGSGEVFELPAWQVGFCNECKGLGVIGVVDSATDEDDIGSDVKDVLPQIDGLFAKVSIEPQPRMLRRRRGRSAHRIERATHADAQRN